MYMQGADSWRNETLNGRRFSFGHDFFRPDSGRLEFDFIEMTDGDGEPVNFLFIYMIEFVPPFGRFRDRQL